MEVSKNIVVWCGSTPNQRALANKIYKQFGLAGIVVDKKITKKPNRKGNTLIKRLYDYWRFRQINRAWQKMQHYYNSRFTHWPEVPVLEVKNINSAEAKTFTESLKPYLIIVSGTSLVKESLLSTEVGAGIMNLHTGLSPYVKGGPNCTNWCIANDEWHLVGNTIMWINAGIDTGNIITSETIDIRQSPTLYDAHITVMEHAHDLYMRAINYVLQNRPPYISVPQKQLGKGNLYLTKMWNADAKKRLLKNWKKRNWKEPQYIPKTVSLPKQNN